MRVADAPLPAITPHILPSTSPMASWPGQLRIGIERVPQSAYAWDDPDATVAWDDPAAGYLWDEPLVEVGYIDAVCDFQALSIETGPPDELGLFGAGTATLTLDNRTGAWSQYAVDGRLVYFAPGRRVAVWWATGGEDIPGVPAHLDPTVGTVTVPYTAGTGVTVVADPPDAATYWRTVGANAEIGRNPAGTLYPGTIRTFEVTQTGVGPAATIATTSTETGSSLGVANAIPAPAGQTAGDLLIGICSHDNPGATNITASTGWTQVTHVAMAADIIKFAVFARVADGGVNDSLAFSGLAAQDYAAGIVRVTGHGVTNIAADIKVATATDTVASAADPPSLATGTTTNWLWLAVTGVDLQSATDVITSMPASYTSAINVKSPPATTSTAFGVGYRTTAAASEDPGAFTLTPNRRWIAATIAIPPGATGGDAGFRFDAADYPGTGTSYVDPRGDTWTLTAPGAIVPTVPAVAGDGDDWWLAHLYVADWAEVDQTVVVTCVDAFAQLALDFQREWLPGYPDHVPSIRLAQIMVTGGSQAELAGDIGDVTLTAQVTDRSPLDEMQIVALSDGGILFGDADGRVMYRDRTWPAGRHDQPADVNDIAAFSDNVCSTGLVNVWNAELVTADDRIATRVHLENVAGLVADAVGPDLYEQRYPYTHPDVDQWTDQAEGDAVAAALLAQRSTPRVAVDTFELYLNDPNQPAVWLAAVDCRIGDRIRFLHEFPAVGGGTGLWDLISVVGGIRHDITPDSWITELAGTRSVDTVTVQRWDRTYLTWDDPDPLAVWRF